jgi:transglutaminase-like putative cysteine protease
MAVWSTFFPQSTPAQQPVRISLTFYFFLVGAFLLTLVPHVIELPVWVSISVVIALVIRSFMEVYRFPIPSTTFCFLVSICFLFGVTLQFKTIFGRDAGMALTAGLLAIKFFELRGPRDIAVIIFSGYFVVMCSLLFSQVIELFIYCLIMMWVLTALLRRLQIGDLPEDHLLPMLRWAGVVFLQALPLAIFLFFFFPRYQGKLQLNMGEAALGFTDTVRPGDIAYLSKNSEEVMYVRFEQGDVPLVESMYWRGLVLWQYRDGAWTTGRMGEIPMPESDQPTVAHGSNVVDQVITIYPHFQKWLFALDWPVSLPTSLNELPGWCNVHYGDILQLSAEKAKIDHKQRYEVISSFVLNDQELSDGEQEAGIQLPVEKTKEFPEGQIDPDTKALADRLRKENPDNTAYVHAVLRYFRQEHFVYTATPGAHSRESTWLHDFLFVSKAGFCEHFASAFAVLMRLEKVPARVVVGYLGGTYNPYENIYTINQSNAHAWDEVWVDAKVQPEAGKRLGHWARVDPTALLPSGEGAHANSGQSGDPNATDELAAQATHHQASFSDSYLPQWISRSLNEMQLRREQIEANWDDLVFSYDPMAQNRLAQLLGFGRDPAFMLGLACLVAMGLCVVIFRKWIKRQPPLSPVEDLYASFCRNMAQRGIPRATWEGPLSYTRRVAEAFPEQDQAIRNVGSIVARSRYGPAPVESTAPAELKSLLLLLTASQAASSSRDQT